MNDNYSKTLFKYNLVIIYFLTLFVIQSEAKNLENIKEDVHVDALEILPPFGRLNDTLCNRYIITNIFCS